MKNKISDYVEDIPKLLSLIILTAFLFWGFGCPARCTSLIDPVKQITRPELQIELDHLIATAQYRMADLDKQDELRDVIFKNALLMAETGTLNPIGIMTMLAGLYGITRGGSDLVKKVKKKRENNK